MTHSELKKVLERLVASYFKTNPLWSAVKGVTPNNPLVVLNLGAITRHYQPIRQYIKGVPIDGYPSQTTFQIDLYTKGMATGNTPGVLSAYENTAVNDLTEFVNFLNSEYVDNWCEMHDISLLANKVRDFSAVINDTTWDYRAFTEIEVGFTQTAVGFTAVMYEHGIPYYDNGEPMYDDDGYSLNREGDRVLDVPPLPVDGAGKLVIPDAESTSSGGRTKHLAEQSADWFEAVETPKYE